MLLNRHKFMAEAGDEGGEGGGGVEAPPAEGGASTPPANAPPAEGGSNTPDVAAELAALRAEVANLSAAKAEAEAVAETQRVAGLSAAEKLTEDRAAFQAEVESSKADIRREARGQALNKLGVKDAYRNWAPDVDPRTAEGAKELEDWAKAHPEVVQATPHAAQSYAPPPRSKLAQVLSGAANHPYMSAEGLRKLLN